jgi:hypothetical protein
MRESRIPEKGNSSPQERERKNPRTEAGILTSYINAALRKAHYEMLPDGVGYFGTIEGLQGV